MKTFDGQKLRQAREQKRLSVSDLHYLLINKGVTISAQSIRNWEAGERIPRIPYLAAVAKILEKDVSFFLRKDYVKVA